MRNHYHNRVHKRRAGFTLVELIMAVAIIAVLIGLLIPAVAAARRTAQVAQVRSEISQLEAAIADFNAKFGQNPPSRVTLYEQASGWTGDPSSRSLIRGLWNKYDFATRDLNGDGDDTDSIVLLGDQAIVFFLGGGYSPTTGFVGFSSNPINPFDLSSPAATRVGPFFEFEPSRVFDGSTPTRTPPATYSTEAPLSLFPVYVDPIPDQTRPYVYASAYDGLGYNDSPALSDVSTYCSDSNPAPPDMTAEFRVYLTNTKDDAMDPDPAPYKPKGFQIISPGFDALYGTGGPYKPDGNIKLPARVKSGGPPPVDTLDANRKDEWDNITNFASGMLQP